MTHKLLILVVFFVLTLFFIDILSSFQFVEAQTTPGPSQDGKCDISLKKYCTGHGWNSNIQEPISHSLALKQCNRELEECVDGFSALCQQVCGANQCGMTITKGSGKCVGQCHETYCEAKGKRIIECKCFEPRTGEW